MGSRGLTTRGRAFGLELDVRFDCPGLPPAPARTPDTSPVLIEETTENLLGEFPDGSERLWQLQTSDGAVHAHFDADPGAGYLMCAEAYGTFVVRPGGTHVLCASQPGPPWRWQRYLVGQVLPFVAVLHGLEPFHASAVRFGSAAIAFFGPSGGGKSSIAVACGLRGACYIADDVLAIEAVDGERFEVVAHPGFGLASLRHDLARRLTSTEIDAVGRPVGSDEHALRLAIDVVGDALPLTCGYFLERTPERDGDAIDPIVPLDPRMLLASSYNLVLRDADRLTRQLEVCSRLARGVRFFRLSIRPDVGPFELAELVEDHVASVTAFG